MKEMPEFARVMVRKHVVLRPLTPDDASDILAILESDSEIRKRVGFVAEVKDERGVRTIVDNAAIDDNAH